jgi:hypothetical protein
MSKYTKAQIEGGLRKLAELHGITKVGPIIHGRAGRTSADIIDPQHYDAVASDLMGDYSIDCRTLGNSAYRMGEDRGGIDAAYASQPNGKLPQLEAATEEDIDPANIFARYNGKFPGRK